MAGEKKPGILERMKGALTLESVKKKSSKASTAGLLNPANRRAWVDYAADGGTDTYADWAKKQKQ
jgi:hypothetical protein